MSETWAPPYKLPVFRTVGLSLQWTLAIVLRHWIAVVVFAVVLGLLQWLMKPEPMVIGRPPVAPGAGLAVLGFLMLLLFGVICIVIALVTHNEVLRGPSGFDATTLGRGPWRGLGYLLDGLIVSVVPFIGLAAFVGTVATLGWLVASGSGMQAVAALATAGMMVGMIGFTGVVSRLMLRLPSRALGNPESWGDIWRMGRGNTLRLFAGNVLLWLLLAVPVILLSLPFIVSSIKWTPKAGEAFPEPSVFVMFLTGALAPVEIILFCAFLSVAYAQLKQGNSGPPA